MVCAEIEEFQKHTVTTDQYVPEVLAKVSQNYEEKDEREHLECYNFPKESAV